MQESHHISSGSDSEDSFLRCRSSDHESVSGDDDQMEEKEDALTTSVSSIDSSDVPGADIEADSKTEDMKQNPVSHHPTQQASGCMKSLPGVLFNDYEIGHVRSADEYTSTADQQNHNHSNKNNNIHKVSRKKQEEEEKQQSRNGKEKTSSEYTSRCAAEKERKALFDGEVEAHCINQKYREFKRQLPSSGERASMKSARNLWFDEVS
jgi:hypothetical protein